MRGTILTKVPTEMASASKDGVLVSADGVYDYILKQFLEDINKFLLETKADIDDLGDLVLLDFLTPSDVGALPEETKYAGADVLGGPAISANKINTNAGSNIRPVYFENGVPVQINHTIEKDVPQNAKFTDTLNTAGATNTSDKIYLIGAKTLDENPQTYTLDTAYVGPDGYLYSGGEKVITDTSNKADKVSGATENNFVAFDENGNLKDSNKSANSFANASHEHTISEITNFPNLGSAAYENSGNFVTEVAYDSQLKKITRTKNNVTSEVLSLNTLKLDLELGQPNGIATLDESGKVSSTQLPAYVDDVIELNDITDTAPVECAKDDIYYNTSTKKLYIATAVNTWSNEGKTPESGKIYTNLSNDKTYRWGGTTMVIISETLAIGTTLNTAADGKVVYDHINNINNPHRVTAAQLGLENVGNFKAVSTVVNQGLTDEEQTNARNNINAESKTRASSHYTNYNNPHLVTKVQVGLENVTNDVQVKRTEMGEPNGVATLDPNGKIPSLLIPNNVRDIKLLKTIKISNNTNVAAAIEGEYYYDSLTKKLYVTIKTVSDEEPPITSYSWLEVSPESDKIYINTENNKSYRWNGTDMVDIIGTSQETAASEKIVDDHIKNKLNPHEVTATQIGLGHVDDKSSATLKSEIMTAANVKEVLETTNGTEKFFREDGTWLIPNYPDVSDFATKEEAGIEIDNIHQYVDLGLPSGTLWATMNVGASSETDYGNYYQYGKGAAQYAATSGDSNYGGTEDPLDSSVDTASQVWGGSWHMPTRAQMQELTANTTYEWTTINGVNGGKFTATNGNYVFFPAAGDWDDGSQNDVGGVGNYWGSSPHGSGNAYYLYFDNGFEDVDSNIRKLGYSVRPVCDSVPVKSTKADKVVNATTGNLAGLNSEGNLTDSGKKASDFANSTHTHTKNQITDFPTLGTAAAKDVPSSGNASSSQVVLGNDSRLSDSRNAADVSAWAKAANKPSYNLDEVADGTNRKIPTKVSDLTNDSNFTSNTGTVTSVKVGTDSYSPSSGVVSLPAYPTSLPADGGNAATVNNHSVNADVPADADFTNTWRPLGTGANDACAGNDSRLSDSRDPKSHTHGNIKNTGALQDSDVAVANGDKLVIADSSDSGKVARSDVQFDGTTTSKALTPKGTFETFARPSELPITMVASGTGHAGGLVPDTPSTAGTTKFLREDGTWQTPDYPTSLPASDVRAWAKASTKPKYKLSEVGYSASVVAISSATSSSCSVTGAGNAGKQETIIYTNSTGGDLVVTVPTTYTTPDGQAIELTCPSGGYVEVSYINISGTIYARGL